jgi:hypothetical protein
MGATRPRRAYRVATEASRGEVSQCAIAPLTPFAATTPIWLKSFTFDQLGTAAQQGHGGPSFDRRPGGEPDAGPCRQAVQRTPFVGRGAPAGGADARACLVAFTAHRLEYHLRGLWRPAWGRVDAPRGGAGAPRLPSVTSTGVSSKATPAPRGRRRAVSLHARSDASRRRPGRGRGRGRRRRRRHRRPSSCDPSSAGSDGPLGRGAWASGSSRGTPPCPATRR